VGPTGTGKTSMVRKLCNKYPEGILYQEVVNTNNFLKYLAKELGMKIASSNIFDIILGYFSSTYIMYYSLPTNQKQALDFIIETLKPAALKFHAKYGTTPTMFIDGADLLAKYNKELFIELLIQAKALANEGMLTIVLVSSEGSVIPIVQKLSGVSRCNKFFEITDVKDEDAVDYLIKRGFSEKLSNMFVQYTGGRCIHLVNGGILHKRYTTMNPSIEDHVLYDKTIRDLFTWKLMKQSLALKMNEPHSIKIVHSLSLKKNFILLILYISTHLRVMKCLRQ